MPQSHERLFERDIAALVLKLAAPLLGKSLSEIDPADTFAQLGLSSLDAIQIASQLSERLHRKISPTLFFDFPTVLDLAAHLSQWQAPLPASAETPTHSAEPIAIIGLACRFPRADDPEAFWNNLETGVDGISPLPEGRWPRTERSPVEGGFIRDVDRFDNDLFGITAPEARSMDPQQRHVLELSWQALENARYDPRKLSNTRTGVFLGQSSFDYAILKRKYYSSVDVFEATGNAHSIAANRISYFYNFKGPSVAVDTACSSSLVALHLACQSLRNAEADLCLAGGINLMLSPEPSEIFTKAAMLSPDARCKTFSADANGYVRGEGGGFVLLKRLADARRDGDKILAVVQGSGMNQDGATNGLTAPNGRAQENLIRQVLKNARIAASDVDYVEAHGTGTPLGDPIEFNALARVFGNRLAAAPLWVGSVKSHIGHLEAAAGIAGVIKVVLALQKNKLPPQLHFSVLNPEITCRDTELRVIDRLVPWEKSGRTRVAGVSSFGFGGTNAHVVLADPPDDEARLRSFGRELDFPAYLFCLSASSAAGLKTQGEEARRWLERNPHVPMGDLCKSLYHQRAPLKHRLAIRCCDRAELENRLDQFLRGTDSSDVFQGRVDKKKSPDVAFLFTGQGSQSPGMGSDLYRFSAAYRTAFNRCLDLLQPHFELSLLEVLRGADEKYRQALDQTDYGQALLFALEYSLVQFWHEVGIDGRVLLGHSLGEIVAACVSGQFRLEDACRLVALRGNLLQKSPPGAMCAVYASETAVREIGKRGAHSFDIAAINGPNLCVASGNPAEISTLEKVLAERGTAYRRLNVQRGFHSHLMDASLEDFRRGISSLDFHAGQLKLISCVTADELREATTAGYWTEHIRKPVDFAAGIRRLAEENCAIHLEIGPHPTLLPMVPDCVPGNSALPLASLNRRERDAAAILGGIAKFFVHGIDVHLAKLYPNARADVDALPVATFEEKRFWLGGDRISAPAVPETPIAAFDSVLALTELKSLLAVLLEVTPEDISEHRSILEMGADSLVLLHALEKINEKYAVNIGMADIFQGLSTVQKIADYIGTQSPRQTFAAPTAAIDANPPLNPLTPAEPSPAGRGVLGAFRSQANLIEESFQSEKQERFLTDLIRKFTEKTQRSKAEVQKHRTSLADNRVSAGFRPRLKELVYPILCERAQGSRFVDVDGNEYVDFTMGFGVNLFGHSPPFIQRAIENQVAKGMAVGPQSALAGEVAELVGELTGHERCAFVNSGTEAVMTAVRLARAATKRTKVVIFEGSYHGHFDGVLGRPNTRAESVAVAPGIPASLLQDLIVLPYGTEESLDFIRGHASTLAAVLVEPIQSRYPDFQPGEFLQAVRKVTETSQTAFIWDEVICGFRMAVGGAQQYFGIKADIAAYGKILGGGLPIGAVAGSRRFLDFIDGGEWRFGDDSFPASELTFFAGTFCKHPLAMAAAKETLLMLKASGPDLLRDLNQKTQGLADELNLFFRSRGVAIEIVHCASLFRFKFAGNIDWLFYLLNYTGIYIWEGRNLFLSTAHTAEDIRKLVDSVKYWSDQLIELGYLKVDGQAGDSRVSLPFIEVQRRFGKLAALADPNARRACQVCLAMELSGPLDRALFIESVKSVASRHDGLSAQYDVARAQVHFRSTQKIAVADLDFSQAADPDGELQAWMKDEAERPLDLRNGPLRLSVVRITDTRHVLTLVGHHLAVDGVSAGVFTDEIARMYSALRQGQKPKLDKIFSFADYMGQYEQRMKEQTESRAYWKERLKRFPAPISLDRHSAPPFAGARLRFELGAEDFRKVKMFGFRNSSSLLMTLLAHASFAIRETWDLSETVVGVPVMGHTSIKQSMIGNCVNLIPIHCAPGKFANPVEMIPTLRETLLESIRHADCPYSYLEADLGRPLFNICVNVEPIGELPKFHGLTPRLLCHPVAAAEFPLILNAMKIDNTFQVELDYQYSSLSPEEAAAFLARLQAMLVSL